MHDPKSLKFYYFVYWSLLCKRAGKPYHLPPKVSIMATLYGIALHTWPTPVPLCPPPLQTRANPPPTKHEPTPPPQGG